MDLTEAEEARLPLPKAWVRTLSTSSNELMYRNISTGLEVMDHPYIIAATNAAKKLRLPDGWSVKVVTLDDDTEDSFYRNERAGISMWDHPLLRQCLASVLIDESWDSHAKTVLEGDTSADSPERTKSNLKRYADESAEMQRSYEKFKESQRMNKETASRNIGFKKNNYLKDGHEDALDKSFLGNRASEVVRDYDKSLSPRGIDAKSDGEQSITNRSDRKVSFDEHFQNHENMRDGQDSEQDENQEKDQQTFGPTINIEEQTSSRLHSPSHELDSQSRDSKVSRESKDSIGDTGTDSHSYSANSPTHRFSADPIKEIPQSFDTGIQPGNYLSNHAELWNRYRVEADKSVQEDTEKTRSFGGSTVPPQSVAGVHVLTEDAKLANERVHELVIQLRAKIASAEGMDCRVMQNDETAIVSVNGPEDFDAMNISTDQLGSKKTVQDLTVLGADIMSELRHHPEYIISAMALCDPLAPGMSQIAFTMLHRILHPLSTDSSLSTLFLLQCINFQVEELIAIGHLFPELDKKKLASRALYISDPTTALNWNPLAQPLPVLPATQSETVLSCALRTYAIRRDVTSFFRCAWKPILNSISDVTKSSTIDGTRTWNNLVLTACRIIECTFNEAVITSWPASATAVARSLFQIGGNDALHYYMFNYLILPNILRLLAGDHSSIENERTIRLDGMADFSTRYYNIDSWWPLEGIEKAPYNPATTLIWVLWKFYIGSALINQKDIEVLYAEDFFRGYPVQLRTAGVKDKKLRIMLLRCQRRIDHGCQCLLRMPLDMHGSSFLNIDPETALRDLADISQTIPKKSMEKRMSSIVLKPRELVGLTIVGRHEIANIFSDVGVALEARGARFMEQTRSEAAASPNRRATIDPTRTHYADGEVPEGLTSQEASLFLAVSEYLLVNDAFGDEVGEEFLVMPFQYRSENEPIDTLVTMIENNRLSIGENSDENTEDFTLDGDSAPGDVRRSGYQEEKTDQQLALHDSMTLALNEAVKQRYSQLMVGVDLANRYEAALLSALECLDESHSMHRNLILPAPLDIGVEDKISDTQNALNRLLSNDTRWYDRVELDVDFVRDEAHYLERHTKSSITYVKPSLNGLEPVRHIKLHPSALPGPNHYAHEDLFEDILDLKLDDGSDKGHQTYNEMQRDFYNSFRFHSAQKHVAASTSILDKGSTVKTAPHSKLRRLADKNRKKSKTSIGLSQVRQGRVVDESGEDFIRTSDRTGANAGKSKFTKPVVDESRSSFMKPTQSHISRERATMAGPQSVPQDRKTHHQLTIDYFNSLRGGDDNSDNLSRSSTKALDPNIKYNAYDGHATMIDLPPKGDSKAQPFPEHLRHRIRGSKEAQSLTQSDMEGMEGAEGEEAISARMAARRDMQDLLDSYHNEFLSGSPGARADYSKPDEDNDAFDRSEEEDEDEDYDEDEQADEYYDHGYDWGGEHATEQVEQEKERFSNFSSSEVGSQASRSTRNTGKSSATGSKLFRMFDVNSVKDEDLPKEIPMHVPADEDLRDAWKHMSADEKRKSIHYFFPKGSEAYARWFGKGGGKRSLPTPIRNTKFFQGGQIKGTESSRARMRDRSRRSIYLQDAHLGAIPGVRHDASHGYSSESKDRAALQKKKKPAWRPAGPYGMDTTHSRVRDLAARPKQPLNVPKEYRGLPKSSFWGTHPHLNRSRMDQLFPAGAHPLPEYKPATERAHYTKLLDQTKNSFNQGWSEFDDRQSNSDSENVDTHSEPHTSGAGAGAGSGSGEERGEEEDNADFDFNEMSQGGAEDGDTFGNRSRINIDDFSPEPENRSAPRPYADKGKASSIMGSPRERLSSMGGGLPMGAISRGDTRQTRSPSAAAAATSKSLARNPAPMGTKRERSKTTGSMSPGRLSQPMGVQYTAGQYSQFNIHKEYKPGRTYQTPEERQKALQEKYKAEHVAASNAAKGSRHRAGTHSSASDIPKNVSFKNAQPSDEKNGKSALDDNFTSNNEDSGNDQNSTADEREEAAAGHGEQPSGEGNDDEQGGEEEEEDNDEDAKPEAQPETPKSKSYYDEDDDNGKYDYSPEKSPAPPVIPRAGRVLRDATLLEEALLNGVEMVKHGRRGNPHHKMLKLSEDKTKFFWYEIEGKKSLRSSVLSLMGSGEQEPKFIMVESITEVRKGVQTDVLVAARNVDPYISLSILTADRSLDMTFDSHAKRDLVVRALHVILRDRKNVHFF